MTLTGGQRASYPALDTRRHSARRRGPGATFQREPARRSCARWWAMVKFALGALANNRPVGPLQLVAELLVDGEVVPFLGAGANLCNRPDARGAGRPAPCPRAAASSPGALAEEPLPGPGRPRPAVGLASISRLFSGRPALREMHAVLTPDFRRLGSPAPGAAAGAAARAWPRKQLLILTTNYDDLAERALEEAGGPSTSSGTRRSGARSRDVSSTGRRTGGRGDRAPEQVHGALARPSGPWS